MCSANWDGDRARRFAGDYNPTDHSELFLELGKAKKTALPALDSLVNLLDTDDSVDVAQATNNFLDIFSQSKLFNFDYYKSKISNDESLSAGAKHDLGNEVGNLWARIDLLKQMPKKSFLRKAIELAISYLLILEDICLRVDFKDNIPASAQEGFVFTRFSTALQSNMSKLDRFVLDKEKSRGKRTKIITQIEDLNLATNEHLLCNNGFLLASTLNEVKNAIQKNFDLGTVIADNTGLDRQVVLAKLANVVVVQAHREGNEYVIRVIDDGRGMSDEQLNPQSEGYIFKAGVSGDDSTGYGLADQPARLASISGKMNVASRPKLGENNFGEASVFAMSPDKTAEEMLRTASVLLGGEASTIFEMRLPITTKSND